MKNPYWFKLRISFLDDPAIGKLPEWAMARFMKFLLIAKEYDHGGQLPSVRNMAWRARLDETKVGDALRALEQVGEVHRNDDGWMITHFAEWDAETTNSERCKQYRKRQKHGEDEDIATRKHVDQEIVETQKDVENDMLETRKDVENDMQILSSMSSSESISESFKDLENLYAAWDYRAETPKQACEHPALLCFQDITGIMPGERDAVKITQWLILTGKKFKLAPKALVDYEKAYFTWWTSQKGRDGRSYSPLNLAWMLKAYNREAMEAQPEAVGITDNVKKTGALDALRKEYGSRKNGRT